MDILVCQLAGQRLGLRLADVQEVARAVSQRELPRAPRVVEGVIDVRGTMVPVLDLRAHLGLPPKPVELGDHLVLVHLGPRTMAIRVDQTMDIMKAARESDVNAAVPGAARMPGLVCLQDGILMVDDLAALMTEAEARALEQALLQLDILHHETEHHAD